jgi:hypothetical protein
MPTVLEEALRAVCEAVAGITMAQFRALLSHEGRGGHRGRRHFQSRPSAPTPRASPRAGKRITGRGNSEMGHRRPVSKVDAPCRGVCAQGLPALPRSAVKLLQRGDGALFRRYAEQLLGCDFKHVDSFDLIRNSEPRWVSLFLVGFVARGAPPAPRWEM